LNKKQHIARGFTLFELLIVISIFAVLLTVFVPVFQSSVPFSQSESNTGQIVNLIEDLKKRSVSNQESLSLHIDTSQDLLWISGISMDDEAMETAREKGVPLSEEISILDIEYPGLKEDGQKEYVIRFSKYGYSDFALIHMTDDGEDLTIWIEPFLFDVQVIKGHRYLEECI